MSPLQIVRVYRMRFFQTRSFYRLPRESFGYHDRFQCDWEITYRSEVDVDFHVLAAINASDFLQRY